MSALKILSKIFGSKNVVRNISYGDEPLMSYDEYAGPNKSAPVVIFWHGGSWQNGDKAGYGFVGSYFQKMGFNCVVVNYPKYPEQTFPGFIKDAQKVLDNVRKSHPKSPMFLSGHSSGAHTALITSMKQRENPVDGVIAFSAPNWFSVSNWPRWQKIFTDDYESKKQETYTYVESSPKTTRYFSIHGANDLTVSPKGAIKLHEYMMTNGINSKYKMLKMVNHFVILVIFLPKLWPGLRREIKNFIDTNK